MPSPSSYLSGMEIVHPNAEADSWRGGHGSFSDDGSVPGMITTASLQSSAGDFDDCSLSSGSSASPRSIFQTYWSSAAQRRDPGLEKKGEDGASARSQTADKGGPGGLFESVEAPIAIAGSAGRKEPSDDSSIDYQSALPPPLPTRGSRRRILPAPPSPTLLSSSLLQPRMPQLTLRSYAHRKSFSTAALLAERGTPHQSCLRKARTAVDALGGGAEPKSCDDHKKSVSFYSRVSVLEFAVPSDQRKRQTGWHDHFSQVTGTKRAS